MCVVCCCVAVLCFVEVARMTWSVRVAQVCVCVVCCCGVLLLCIATVCALLPCVFILY